MENGNLESWQKAPYPHGAIYEVSDLGRVRCYKSGNTVRNVARLKKPQLNKKNGYWYVILSIDKVIKSWTVNRLVLTVFKGERSRYFDARHLDGNKANNALSNLEWGTRLENESDKKLHEKVAKGSINGQSKLVESQVIEIRRKHISGKSMNELATTYGVCTSNISAILRNETWKHI